MRFMLRCIFWLSIVYASILSNAGFHILGSGRDDLAATARTAITAPVKAATDAAFTGLATSCKRDPAACLADSARLTALVTTSESDTAKQDAPVPGSRRPNPRHQGRGAMQARMP